MSIAYVGIGSNLGEREDKIAEAIAQFKRAGDVLKTSPIYEAAPIGRTDQPDFLNCAVEIETQLSPRALLDELKAIEKELGRRRKGDGTARTMDLDLLLYDNFAIEEEGLTVPHPRMHERLFVLEPLATIAPNVVHPLLNRTILELKENVGKGQRVQLHQS